MGSSYALGSSSIIYAETNSSFSMSYSTRNAVIKSGPKLVSLLILLLLLISIPNEHACLLEDPSCGYDDHEIQFS